MKAFSIALFDLGSTLIYFEGDLKQTVRRGVEALQAKLIELGVSLPAEFAEVYTAAMQSYYHRRNEDLTEIPAQQLLRQVLAGLGLKNTSEDQLEAALDAYYEHPQRCWRCENDAISTLRALRAVGLRIGLVSNAVYDRDIQVLVDRNGLRPYLDFVLSSAACGLRKPHPRIFELALEALGGVPERALMVGDLLETDILGANRMGIQSIWLTRRANMQDARQKLAEIQPVRTIAALSELPSLLANWDVAA